MKIFEKLSLFEHLSKTLKVGQTAGNRATFYADNNDKTASLMVYLDTNTYCNFRATDETTGKHRGGTILDFEIKECGLLMNEAISKLKKEYNIIDNVNISKTEQPKRKELITNFNKYQTINSDNRNILTQYLNNKGFSFSMIQSRELELLTIEKNTGVFKGLFLSETDGYGDVVIFPCKDANNKIVGGKIRRKDGEKIQNVKSVAIGQMSTGLLYNNTDIFSDYAILVEGEIDYITLVMLGFKNVIGNLCGVAGGFDLIKQKLKKTTNIFVLYDNDEAGVREAKRLQAFLNRPIFLPKYPKIKGVSKYDIHDLFKMGYDKKDFQLILKESKLYPKEKPEILQIKREHQGYTLDKISRIVYLSESNSWYDTKQKTAIKQSDVTQYLRMTKQGKLDDVQQIKGITYSEYGTPGYLNILNKNDMIQPAHSTIRPGLIGKLIDNLGGGREENIEWLEKAILYRYTHLDSYMIPIMVLYGAQGSGKGLFIGMMQNILGEDNVLTGIGQDALESEFSAYQGNKQIVEFDEISVNNPAQDIKNANKLKLMALNPTIQTRLMYQGLVKAKNCAWFIITSNFSTPVRLEKGTTNRRYTILKSIRKLTDSDLVYHATQDKGILANYLGYLHYKYPSVVTGKAPEALDNEEKKSLVMATATDQDDFFDQIEKVFPYVTHFTFAHLKSLINAYEDTHGFTKLNLKYLKTQLPMKYSICTTRINGKSARAIKLTDEIEFSRKNEIRKAYEAYSGVKKLRYIEEPDIWSAYIRPDEKANAYYLLKVSELGKPRK